MVGSSERGKTSTAAETPLDELTNSADSWDCSVLSDFREQAANLASMTSIHPVLLASPTAPDLAVAWILLVDKTETVGSTYLQLTTQQIAVYH